jgi:hypothetical protein
VASALRGADAGAAAPGDPVSGDTPPPGDTPPATGDALAAGLVSQWSELGLRVRGRSELGGDWNRFRPCTDRFEESCNPTLLPQLRPDLNLAIELQGTILDRVSVDVDYDQLREFGGTNTISFAYQGGADDLLGRLEVGDVTFRLPRSRFLTEGLPAGNFGFQARGRVGPVELRSVWAEQRGDLSSREFRLTGVGNQRRFAQDDTVVLDDADYVDGQFFFLLDPRDISGFPHIDVLNLDAGSAPASRVPGVEPVQLYRFENDPTARQQVQGWIQADAVAADDRGQVTESGWFRALRSGQDYYVHPSGLWVALRNPLGRDEMLAVTYVTAAGDTVGTYNPEQLYANGGRPQLRLLKASNPNHQPGRPTWEIEMHQIYRVSASPDVDPAAVEVTISLGELSAGRTFKRASDGRDISFLQLLGLDAESPLDRVDPGYIFSTARDLDLGSGGVQGTFVIFPTLFPFAQPPPNPTLGLTAGESADLLADNANARIYEAEDPFERNDGGLFRLTIPFQVRSEGVISTFSLGALGILEGSERVTLGDRLLVEGVDYQIDYDLGQVMLLDPEALFATSPDASIRATWEQKQVFRTAPTSVFGFNAHLGDDATGSLDVLTLFRTERTLVNRPTLGLEPGSALLGGVNGRLERDLPWMDGLLASLPGLRAPGSSHLSLDGEVALSLPNPNTRGAVFIDDFDATDDRPLSLRTPDWVLGSAPAERTGAEPVLPPVLGAENRATMTWQHQWILEAGVGDSLGIHEGFLPREEIDQQIRLAGTRVREPGLRLIFEPPAGGGGGPHWASITTLLSPTGSDLTQSEFLEFYVAGGRGQTLLVDLGAVSEDAFFIDDEGNTSGLRETGLPWGLGVLDQEADPALGQVWGNAADLRGVWQESCLGDPGRIFRLGDPRANCTRNNGRNDTEDLDGDGNLDTAERTLRYVVRLDGTSPYLARTSAETGTDFRLYRIPLRTGEAVEVNGPFGEADLRAVRHLRFTVAGRGPGDLTLARLRIQGNRWLKRGVNGSVRGLAGDTAAVLGDVEVGPVSRITDGDAYASPPGVLEQLFDPTSAVGGPGVEFNEKSLRIVASRIPAGDRGEVYHRFAQRPRNFLLYRQARLWVVPRAGDFGPDEPASFFFKIGNDPANFYLYRTPLRPATGGGGLVPEDWLPEVRIDFSVFQELRARAEQALALDPPRPGDPPLTLWARDSTYAVVVSDRGRAPNLAAVRELALGIWNRGEQPIDAEVWVDELRLDEGVRDAGVAGALNARVELGGVLDTRLRFNTRGAYFRQLEEEASFQTDRVVGVDSRARLERFLPESWGVEVPLRFSLEEARQLPTFLPGSDVRADRLPGLREVGNGRTRVGLGVRKVTPAENPLLGLVVDGLEADLSWYDTRTNSITGRVDATGVDARVGVERRLRPREIDPLPDFVEPLVRWLLPGPLEDAALNGRIRWAPERIEVGASYARQDADIFRFESILASPADSLARPLPAPREVLQTVAEVGFRPLRSLTADLTFLSTRDLLAPEEAVTSPALRALLRAERRQVAGVDLGWETARTLRTRVAWRPRVVSWLRHEVGVSTRYGDARNPSFVRTEIQATDTLRTLERNANGERDVTTLLSFDPGALSRVLAAAPTEGEADRRPLWARALEAVKPVTFTGSDGLFSRFDRDPVRPTGRYQFGWGGRRDFLLQGGDTAASLTDRTVRRLSGGLGVERVDVDVSWGRTEAIILDARAERTLTSETWPELRVRVDGLDAGAATAGTLRRLTLSGGVRRTRRELVFGQTLQRRALDEWSVPVDVTLGWRGGLTTSYRGSVERGRGEDPTGGTERDRITHRASLSSAFLPPFGLGQGGRGPPEPVRLSVLMSYVAERECRVPRFRPECVPFIDQLNRSVTLTLDTRVSGLEVGLQGSYTDRQSFIGQRRGFTQLQVGLFGQFLLEAGALGRLAGHGLPGG